MAKMAKRNLIEEKAAQIWARTQKWLEEGTFEKNMPQSLDHFDK
jgi:hypothetical protein